MHSARESWAVIWGCKSAQRSRDWWLGSLGQAGRTLCNFPWFCSAQGKQRGIWEKRDLWANRSFLWRRTWGFQGYHIKRKHSRDQCGSHSARRGWESQGSQPREERNKDGSSNWQNNWREARNTRQETWSKAEVCDTNSKAEQTAAILIPTIWWSSRDTNKSRSRQSSNTQADTQKQRQEEEECRSRGNRQCTVEGPTRCQGESFGMFLGVFGKVMESVKF